MAEPQATKNENKNGNETTQNTNIEALLKAQADEFKKLMEEQARANKEQIDALVEKNNTLTEELINLKTNTEAENKLLGENIAAIKEGKDPAPSYNPFKEDILYKVYNETAKVTTIMTGDEVQGIIGSIDIHLKKKLIEGAEKIEKHPYTITLYKNAGTKPNKDNKDK